MYKQNSLFKNYFNLSNRRYIGNKQKLLNWIFENIEKECKNIEIFSDIFAGTGVVSLEAIKRYKKIIINDFLYSNNIIYKAFFYQEEFDIDKLQKLVEYFNKLNPKNLEDNYFSNYYGDKYFSYDSAKIIGFVRDYIEKIELNQKEYAILIASLIYSIDKIANTVGHYDAYFKKTKIEDKFFMKLIQPIKTTKKIEIYKNDANFLAKEIKTDIVYIDPPYNSRQYSRFYHLLENLVKWDKPKLYGVALKPEPENISDYCKVSAKNKLDELVSDIDTKYIALSYNNTYKSKSKSSQNKISLDEIKEILNKKGSTKIYKIDYQQFTTGKTDFENHQEYLFITKVKK